jgi:hypothetical protein
MSRFPQPIVDSLRSAAQKLGLEASDGQLVTDGFDEFVNELVDRILALEESNKTTEKVDLSNPSAE